MFYKDCANISEKTKEQHFSRMCVFTVIAVCVGILDIVPVTGLKEDKVCFLDDQSPACVNHQLGCVRTEIAIQSVQYSYASNCTCVRNKCTSCRSDGRSVSIQASGICSNDYNTDDYWNIVTKCSKKKTCTSPVSNLRQFKECGSMMAFSHVRYRCVDGQVERSTDQVGNEKFTCPQCGKEFTRKNNMSRHMRTAHWGEKFVCEKCTKSFSRNEKLKKHKCALLQQGLSQYQCSKCAEIFSSPRELGVHFRRFHSPVESIHPQDGAQPSTSKGPEAAVEATFEVRMCEDQEEVGQHLTLFYDGLPTANAGQRCVCIVKGSDQPSTDQYNITALDIRMGNVDDQDVPQLVLSSPDNEPTVINHKTDIRPNTLLLTTQLSSEVRLDFKSNHTPERIWIMIEGQRDFRVKCETVTKIPVTKSKRESVDGGTVGGTVGCLLVVIMISMAVFFLYRSRALKRREASTKYEATMKLKRENEYCSTEPKITQDIVLQDSSSTKQSSKHIIEPASHGSEDMNIEHPYMEVDMACDELERTTGRGCGVLQAGQVVQEDDYDCLVTSKSGDNLPEVHYDTTTSASKVVKELESGENEYSYDHLGVSAKALVSANEYDTTFITTQGSSSHSSY